MFQPTRLINTLGVFWGNFNTRLRATNQNLAFHLFCLVSGFFIGNIFGTFLLTLRVFFRWDIFIILGFIAISEFISFQTYKHPKPAVDPDQVKFFYWRPLNLVKLGCLFGFFFDAVKVGS
jgi:putative Mn2+ efflux pump MntP